MQIWGRIKELGAGSCATAPGVPEFFACRRSCAWVGAVVAVWVWFEVEAVQDVPLQILKGQTKDENEKGAQRAKEERKTFYLSYCFTFMFKDLTTIR